MAGAEELFFVQEKAMILDELIQVAKYSYIYIKKNQLNRIMIPTASNLHIYMIFISPTWTSFYG
jgi:hypothetical protein